MTECRCKTCEFKHEYFNTHTFQKRKAVWCRADPDYISKYWKEHKISKAEGFIGFYNIYKQDFAVKKTPAWCPLISKNVRGSKDD